MATASEPAAGGESLGVVSGAGGESGTLRPCAFDADVGVSASGDVSSSPVDRLTIGRTKPSCAGSINMLAAELASDIPLSSCAAWLQSAVIARGACGLQCPRCGPGPLLKRCAGVEAAAAAMVSRPLAVQLKSKPPSMQLGTNSSLEVFRICGPNRDWSAESVSV